MMPLKKKPWADKPYIVRCWAAMTLLILGNILALASLRFGWPLWAQHLGIAMIPSAFAVTIVPELCQKIINFFNKGD